MDIEDKFTAKAGKFKGLKDCGITWHDLYLKGGEDLLREFSAYMSTQHDFFGSEQDNGFLKRLCIVATRLHLTEEQAWYFAFKRLPSSQRFFLAVNKHCPEAVIEATAALKRAELQATNSGAVTGSNETIRKAQLAEITLPENEALTATQKNERRAHFDYNALQNDLDLLRYRLRIAELLYS